MMAITIEDINERLRQDMGTNPLYCWKWQRDLVMLVAKKTMTCPERRGLIEELPQYDYHANPETGLLELDIEYIEEPYPLPTKYHDKWILCALQPPQMSPSQWHGAMMGLAPYPWQGTWTPVGWGDDLLTVSADPGQEFLDISIMISSKMKRLRETYRAKDVEDLDWKQHERREAKKLDRNMDHLGDMLPVGAHNPGAKDFISFPSKS